MKTPLMEYHAEVNRLLLEIYCINIEDAGIEPASIDAAYFDGESPRDYVLWFGEKYDLKKLPEGA